MNIPQYLKKLFKRIFVAILLIILIASFSSSYASLNIDNLAFVIALAIDTGESNKLKVTFQFTNLSSSLENSSSEDTQVVINTIEAPSINMAIQIMNSYMGKKLNLSHCKLIVFSEEVASEGISEYIYTLMNDSQIRPSSNIIVSKCDAKTYLKESFPSLEDLSSQYYEVFAKSNRYSGLVVNSTIGDFFNGLVCEKCSSYAILGGLNTNSDSHYILNGKRDSENMGIAVFKEDHLVGELNAIETLCFSILRNTVKGFMLGIPILSSNDSNSSDYTNTQLQSNQVIDIYFQPSKPANIKVSMVNGSPFVEINCNFNGKIHSMNAGSNYLNGNLLSEISESANHYIASTLREYLYKTSLQFNSDINGIGKKVSSSFLTNQELKNINWLDNYKNSIFKVNIDCNVESGFLLTETE